MKDCKHHNIDTIVNFNFIEDVKRYVAEIRITCADCCVPFRFIGLPCGVDLDGACVSIDATEGRFAVAPKGEVISEIEGGVVGFSVRKVK